MSKTFLGKMSAAAIAITATATILAGCTNNSAGTSASGSNDKPVSGGTLIFARGGDAGNIVPTEAGGNDSIFVVEQMFDTLLTPSKDGTKLEPSLATDYKQSDDQLSWTFNLRKDVKFSDGTNMTAKDVVFSIKTASDPDLPFGFVNEGIKNVEAVDDYTVKIITKSPWAPLPSDVALFSNAIVPANYGGKSLKEFEKNPVGTGPFMFKEWKKGQSLSLVKNPHYWKANRPYLDGVTFTTVGEDNTRLMQVRGGQAHVDEGPSFTTLDSVKKDSSVNVLTFGSSQTDYLIMSNKSKPFKDQHVRAAVGHSVDKESIIKAVLNGNGTPANSFLAPTIWGYDKNQKVREYDLDKAKEELKKSAYPNGFDTTIEVVAGDSGQQTTAQIVQESLKKIGINAKIVTKDDSAAGNDRVNGTYDMAFTLSTTDISDPDELVKFVAVESGGANAMRTFFPDEKITKWASEAAAATDNDKRLDLYSKIQTEFNEQQPLVPLYYSPNIYITSKKLHDFAVNEETGAYLLTDAWIEK
ncbi:ABC transporter substrate-binding protein [Bifidobacterium biavatii]|uniref:ABC-type dipeptide transport system, extracellular component n=1 Tax=Bifidobacterium biavatii DSM 23969 TaxID=1437608 RepID=A0A087A1S1_9BIFI|nr:ABC transporter substrate-binding protein [Bifidobacterium biavatii]KFI52721.1 ABC-type dipeptide transport system, extracellular component [Bifidobacterium biavatii DSM 23969]